MDLQEIQTFFNRAWHHTFERKKLLTVFFFTLMCGLLVIFFKGLALQTGQWAAQSLIFLPIFISSGVLLALGVVLIRIYHDEIKKREISYRNVIGKSLDIIIGSAYLSIPIILSYLLLWMLLGVFFLLNDIPGLGGVFSVILAFAPFLLNVAALVLCVISISMLFFITPIIALKGINRIQLAQVLAKRLQEDMFLSLLLATIAAGPLLLLSGLLTLAAYMTGSICYVCDNNLYTTLQWFFIMIPFTAFLSPAIVFFFNFAAESHVRLRRRRLGE